MLENKGSKFSLKMWTPLIFQPFSKMLGFAGSHDFLLGNWNLAMSLEAFRNILIRKIVV